MSYTNLSTLKADFLSGQNRISSRELLVNMEQILFGTNQVFQFFAAKQAKVEAASNEELYVAIKQLRTQPIEERYPILSGNITQVSYHDRPPQEWDVATDRSEDTIGLYVRLDNQWVRRCEIGDDMFVEQDIYTQGYRLNNV